MKYEKFKIVNLVKDLIINIDNNLVNFPKKEIELKQLIKKNAYELLLVIYEGNVTTNMEKRQDLSRKCNSQIEVFRFFNKLVLR